jgi:hypothetical protein
MASEPIKPVVAPAAVPPKPVTPVAAPAVKPVAPVAAAAVKPAASSVPKSAGAPAPKPTVAAPAAAKTPAAHTFQLPPAVYSPALVESVMYDIQYYLDWVRQNKIRKTVGAKAKEEPTHSAETAVVINAWLAGKPATIESLEALHDALRDIKLPQVHIMLAALPNRAQREALVNWFRTNVSPSLLLSFVADRNLGGGLVVRTPNRVFDYTWKQQLIAGRSKLAEILHRV